MEMQIKIALPNTRMLATDMYDLIMSNPDISATVDASRDHQTMSITVDQDDEETVVFIHQVYNGYTNENTTDIAKLALRVRDFLKQSGAY